MDFLILTRGLIKFVQENGLTTAECILSDEISKQIKKSIFDPQLIKKINGVNSAIKKIVE